MKHLALLLLLVSSLAFGQGAQRITQATTNDNGFVKVISGATISVCGYPTCSAVNLYQEVTLSVPIHNPLVADSNGNYTYYAVPGTYIESTFSPGTVNRTVVVTLGGGGGGGGGNACTPGFPYSALYNGAFGNQCLPDPNVTSTPTTWTDKSPNGVHSAVGGLWSDLTQTGLWGLGVYVPSSSTLIGNFILTANPYTFSATNGGYSWYVPNADAAGCIQSPGGGTPGFPSQLFIGSCGGGGGGAVSAEFLYPVDFTNAPAPTTTTDIVRTLFPQGVNTFFAGPHDPASPLSNIIQVNACGTDSVAAVSCQFQNPSIPGDNIWVIGGEVAGIGVSDTFIFTDNNPCTDTYVPLDAEPGNALGTNPAADAYAVIQYCPALTTPISVTITPANPGQFSNIATGLIIVETAPGLLDSHNGPVASGGTILGNVISCPVVTTSNNPDLIMCGAFAYAANQIYGAGSSTYQMLSPQLQQTGAGGNTMDVGVEAGNVTTATAYTPTMLAGLSSFLEAFTVAFKVGSTAGPQKPTFRQQYYSDTRPAMPTSIDFGVADAYVVSGPWCPTTLVEEKTWAWFVPAHANATTTPTLKYCGLGPVVITKNGQSPLSAGDLSTTKVAVAVYDGTYWELQDTGGGGGGSGVASIQPQNNGTNYGSPQTGAVVMNFANCTVSSTFTITCPAGGSGTVNSGTASHLGYYASTGTAISDMGADFTFNTHTLTMGGSGILDLHSGATSGFLLSGSFNTGFLAVTTSTGAVASVATSGTKCYPFGGSGGTGCDTPSGTGGTITSSPQYQIPFYSASGTANTLTGSTTILTDVSGNFTVGPVSGTHLGVSGSTGVATIYDSSGTVPNTPLLQGKLGTSTAPGASLEGWFVAADGLGHYGYNSSDAGAPVVYLGTLSGTNTYTSAWPLQSYIKGQCFSFDPGNGSTSTTPTLSINSLGALTFVKNGGSALVSGDMVAGQVSEACYNGTVLDLLNPASVAGSGTVNAGTAGHLGYYATSTNAISDMGADFTFNTHTLSMGTSGLLDLSAATGTAALKVPSNASNTASANAALDFDTTAKNYHVYQNGADAILAAYKSGPTNGQCATWVTDGTAFVLGSATCSAGSVTGTGTSTYLPYWTGTSSLGATADFTFATHTLAEGASGILDLHSGATSGFLLSGSFGTGILQVTTGTGALASIAASGTKCYPFQGSGGTGCDTPSAAGLTSINADATAAQTIVGAFPITVTDTGGGGHTISTILGATSQGGLVGAFVFNSKSGSAGSMAYMGVANTFAGTSSTKFAAPFSHFLNLLTITTSSAAPKSGTYFLFNSNIISGGNLADAFYRAVIPANSPAGVYQEVQGAPLYSIAQGSNVWVTGSTFNQELNTANINGWLARIVGATSQALLAWCDATGVSASTTSYTGPNTYSQGCLSSTENKTQVLLPYAGTGQNLTMETNGQQPGTGSLTATIRLQHTTSTPSDTAVVVTFAANDALNSYSDTTNTFTGAQWDLVDFSLVNAATSTSASIWDLSFEYVPASSSNTGFFVVGGWILANAAPSSPYTVYLPVIGAADAINNGDITTESKNQLGLPDARTVKEFGCVYTAVPTTSAATVALMKNGVSQATLTIPTSAPVSCTGGSGAPYCVTGSVSVAYAAKDLIDLSVSQSSGTAPALASCTIGF